MFNKIFGKGGRRFSKRDDVVSSYRVAYQSQKPAVPGADGGKIAFVHHRTTVFNLGDYLSSPRHYYRFTPASGGRQAVVVGGGVYGNFDVVRKKTPGLDMDRRIRVAWGVGLSRKDENADDGQLRALASAVDHIATRDLEFSSEEVPFCPCASVHNAITDTRPGSETGILLNFDPRASGPDPLAMLDTFDGLVVGTNSGSERDFRALFARTGSLITNSYHTALWGLMSGRKVAIVGFSSKYDNICAMFDLDYRYARYRKGDGAALKAAISDILEGDRFVRAEDPAGRKAKFRALNDAYAARLVEAGAFARIERIPDTEETLSLRAAEIARDYVLREWKA